MRLKGYDYSQRGGYYVTIVTHGRECLFGEIRNDEMVLNNAGNMVVKWWDELGNKFPSVTPDIFVVMPNHFHGIIFIHEIVGADLRVGLDMDVGPSERGEHIPKKRGQAGSPLPNNDGVDKHGMGAHVPKDQGQAGAPLRIGGKDVPLSQIVQWFKTMTTNEYIRGVK